MKEEEPLETVFDTSDESEAMMVQGLLESNEIEVLRSMPPGVFAIHQPPMGTIHLQVFQSQAETARQLIADYQHSEAEP